MQQPLADGVEAESQNDDLMATLEMNDAWLSWQVQLMSEPFSAEDQYEIDTLKNELMSECYLRDKGKDKVYDIDH